MRTISGAVIALAASLCAWSCAPDADASTRARHLILITVDTLRADHLGAWGYARGTSDAAGAAKRGSAAGFTLDELASQGLRFANAFAPRGETCPSLATLFTGRTPLEHCLIENQMTLPESASTLAELLSARGFKTAAFTTNGLLVKGSGFEQGFQVFQSDASPDKDERMLRAADEWLGKQDLKRGPPLFVWVHLMGPHLPYDPLPIDGIDYASLFADPAYRGSASGARAFVDRAYAEQVSLSAADVERVIASYDGEIARIDRLVSQFVRACSERDLGDGMSFLSQSMLVFAADHGEELHERHRYWAHSKSVYGSVLHVPLFLRHPESLKGARVIHDTVSLEDVMPTLCEYFAAPTPQRMHGKSLGTYLRGADTDEALAARPTVSMWRDKIFSLRTKSWRLVSNPESIEPDDPPPGPYPVPTLALFDLTKDPRETTDVSAAHPDVVRELARATSAWLDGLAVCSIVDTKASAERMKVLRDLGYAGDESDGEKGDGR